MVSIDHPAVQIQGMPTFPVTVRRLWSPCDKEKPRYSDPPYSEPRYSQPRYSEPRSTESSRHLSSLLDLVIAELVFRASGSFRWQGKLAWSSIAITCDSSLLPTSVPRSTRSTSSFPCISSRYARPPCRLGRAWSAMASLPKAGAHGQGSFILEEAPPFIV